MKKLLLTILLMMTATVIIAKSKEIKVSTPEEFIKAIGSNRVITVSGIINLSDVLQSNEKSQKAGLTTISEGSEATQRASRENVFDGYQLVLNHCVNLTIKGTNGAALIVAPRYAYILSFRNCHEIEINNLTIGHTDEGYCQGGVLEFNNCQDIQIDRCDLYGCGIEGITATNTTDLDCTKTIIRDCSYSIMTATGCFNLKFTDCDFYRCKEYGLVNLRNNSNTSFVRCRFSQNKSTLFVVENTNIDLRECEIHHTDQLGNIDINDYTSTIYKRDNKELPARNIGPSDRANLTASVRQSVAVNIPQTEEPEDDESGEPVWSSTLVESWSNGVLQLPAKAPVTVKEMTTRFCRYWPGLDGSPQKIMLDFVNKPRQFKQCAPEDMTKPAANPNNPHKVYTSGEKYIEIDTQNGYLRIADDHYTLQAGVWNRSNGHKLFVVNLSCCVDIDINQFIACYDYDPATRKLTPDTKQASRFEEDNNYILHFPRKGKDIVSIIIKSEESTYKLYRWNGQGFNSPVKISEERGLDLLNQ